MQYLFVFLTQIGSSLKTKANIRETTYSSGSMIANITVVLEEELKSPDAVPSNFVELFKNVIKSGKLGNFTVDPTYINIEETFEQGNENFFFFLHNGYNRFMDARY